MVQAEHLQECEVAVRVNVTNWSITICQYYPLRDNIGTTGGAIHIEYPEFRHKGKPYIVMKDNRFLSNMAYFAGNAFHIQMQARYYMGYLDDD